MKKIIITILGFASVIVSCTKHVSIEEEVASYVVPFDTLNASSFEFIADQIGDKDIVILGEAGHGDGKTYEVTGQLMQYLMKEKGFNTIAFEGEGFISLELKNTPRPEYFPDADLTQWIPHWGGIEQTRPFILDILYNKSINWKYIGLEGYSHITDVKEFLYTQLQKSAIDQATLNQFYTTYEELIKYDEKGLSTEEMDFLLQTIQQAIDANIDTTKDGFVMQALINIHGGIEDYKYYLLGGYDNENISINIRDKRMASNLIWYKKNNPDAKIIVRAATFHGAKKIQNVRYRDEDPDLYKSYKLLTEYIIDAFTESKVCSIAFISTEGEVKDIIVGSQLHKIDVKENSMEYYLHQKEIPFGYINYNQIKQEKPQLKNATFNSTVLGYDNKPGQWFDVFDGVFYIRKNEPLKLAGY